MKKTNNSSNRLIQKHIDYIIPSLGLVIALAWNSAFQRFFKANQYLNSSGPRLYAILVTTIIIYIINFLEKTNARLEKESTYSIINNITK